MNGEQLSKGWGAGGKAGGRGPAALEADLATVKNVLFFEMLQKSFVREQFLALTSDQVAQEIMNKYDKHNDGTTDFPEWIEILRGRSNVVEESEVGGVPWRFRRRRSGRSGAFNQKFSSAAAASFRALPDVGCLGGVRRSLLGDSVLEPPSRGEAFPGLEAAASSCIRRALLSG